MTGLANRAAAEGDIQPQEVGASPRIIQLDLEVPNLVPPVVQWAVFDEDPIPGFLERMKSWEDFSGPTAGQDEGSLLKEAKRSSHLKAAWDLGFRQVTGDRVYLLMDRQGISHTYASSGPARREWIATKAVDIDGKPVCWCVPVDVEAGNQMTIVLSAENALDLVALYNQSMSSEQTEGGENP